MVLDVDLLYCWRVGKWEFTSWYVPLALVAKVVIVHGGAAMRLPRAVVIAAAMNAACWSLTMGFPLPVLVWALVNQSFLDRIVTIQHADPASWICTLLAFVFVAATVDLAVLRLLVRRRRSKFVFWALAGVNLVCMTIAGYQTARCILKHPPIALMRSAVAGI
jgi:hypothetical protein